MGSIRAAALDVPSVRREIEHVVGLAQVGQGRLVTLGPLLFFSTSSGDAWMLDPADGYAARLARGGVRELFAIADEGNRLSIEWPCSYCIEGDAMFVIDHSTGREVVMLGYPSGELEAAARRTSS